MGPGRARGKATRPVREQPGGRWYAGENGPQAGGPGGYRRAIVAKQRKTWVYTPGRDPRTKVSDARKAEIERKARELIDTDLTPKSVEPPPKKPKFNYVIGLSTRWHGRFFYFVATYACPFPDALSPTFEVDFARLEHTAEGRFHLAYMRHTGKWQQLFAGLTLDECLKSIRDDPWFHP
jgi:hypothetical protein